MKRALLALQTPSVCIGGPGCVWIVLLWHSGLLWRVQWVGRLGADSCPAAGCIRQHGLCSCGCRVLGHKYRCRTCIGSTQRVCSSASLLPCLLSCHVHITLRQAEAGEPPCCMLLHISSQSPPHSTGWPIRMPYSTLCSSTESHLLPITASCIGMLRTERDAKPRPNKLQ